MVEPCPRLLNLTLSPGSAESPDGPRRSVSLRCAKPKGHDDGHWWPGLQSSTSLATGAGGTITVTPANYKGFGAQEQRYDTCPEPRCWGWHGHTCEREALDGADRCPHPSHLAGDPQ